MTIKTLLFFILLAQCQTRTFQDLSIATPNNYTVQKLNTLPGLNHLSEQHYIYSIKDNLIIRKKCKSSKDCDETDSISVTLTDFLKHLDLEITREKELLKKQLRKYLNAKQITKNASASVLSNIIKNDLESFILACSKIKSSSQAYDNRDDLEQSFKIASLFFERIKTEQLLICKQSKNCPILSDSDDISVVRKALINIIGSDTNFVAVDSKIDFTADEQAQIYLNLQAPFYPYIYWIAAAFEKTLVAMQSPQSRSTLPILWRRVDKKFHDCKDNKSSNVFDIVWGEKQQGWENTELSAFMTGILNCQESNPTNPDTVNLNVSFIFRGDTTKKSILDPADLRYEFCTTPYQKGGVNKNVFFLNEVPAYLETTIPSCATFQK